MTEKEKPERRKATKQEAEQVFKRYIALLYRLIVDEQNNFDLIVGAGDSGAPMAKFAEYFYKETDKLPPPVLYLPIVRYNKLNDATGESGKLDNTVLAPEVKKTLKKLNVTSPENILFVDDEIWKANTASESIRVILEALEDKDIPNRILYTILAENHGFEWHYDIPPVAIRYYAFSNKIPGVNNTIFEIIPERISGRFLPRYNINSKKQLANFLLNKHLKTMENKMPDFSSKLYKKIQDEVTDLDQIRSDLKDIISQLVRQGVREYRSQEIKSGF